MGDLTMARRWRNWRTSSLTLINSTCSCQALDKTELLLLLMAASCGLLKLFRIASKHGVDKTDSLTSRLEVGLGMFEIPAVLEIQHQSSYLKSLTDKNLEDSQTIKDTNHATQRVKKPAVTEHQTLSHQAIMAATMLTHGIHLLRCCRGILLQTA